MSGHRIDIHAHFPIDLHNGPTPDPPWAHWDTHAAIANLDRLGIERQYLSLPALPVDATGNEVKSLATARAVNDALAAISHDNLDRFGGFATIPGDNQDLAVTEAHRALDDLHLHGIALTSNTGGRYLGDSWYDPILDIAHQHNVPVFVHPALNPASTPTLLGRPPYLLEYPLDTARAAVNLVYTNTFERLPNLKMVLAHCGGALPSLAWRLTSLAHLLTKPGDPVDLTRIAAQLRNFYLDTALSGEQTPLACAQAMVGTSHLLYGTDSGAAPAELIETNTAGLCAAMTDLELNGVERGNALRLFTSDEAGPTGLADHSGLQTGSPDPGPDPRALLSDLQADTQAWAQH